MTKNHQRGPLRAAPSFNEINSVFAARAFGGGRAHPRREGEHTDPPANETAEQKAAREKSEADAKAKTAADAKAKEAADAKKAATAEKKRADDLQAELDAERAKHLSDDEKTRAAEVKSKIDNAVSAKEVELTDHFTAIISDLQTEIIDATIDNAFATAGKDKKNFETVLGTLDRSRFIGEDGKVKKDDVTKWATELAGATQTYSSRPPRTGGGLGQRKDRGFGQFASAKQN